MRFLFWLIISFATGLLPVNKAAAQNIRANAVFLKNGSVITGRIIQNDSIAGLKIKNTCGVWFYKPIEYDSIGHFPGGKYFIAKNKGYFNISGLGLLFGAESSPIPSIQMIQGYKFHPRLTTGLGL